MGIETGLLHPHQVLYPPSKKKSFIRIRYHSRPVFPVNATKLTCKNRNNSSLPTLRLRAHTFFEMKRLLSGVLTALAEMSRKKRKKSGRHPENRIPLILVSCKDFMEWPIYIVVFYQGSVYDSGKQNPGFFFEYFHFFPRKFLQFYIISLLLTVTFYFSKILTTV